MAEDANATMTKFGYPATLVAEHDGWVVLLRPQQVTLGSLVLVSRAPATAFGQLDDAAFAALGPVIRRIEAVLGDLVGYDRINYLMLMMVDPDVHFHVIPRYQGTRRFEGFEVADAGWPGPPALGEAWTPLPEVATRLTAELNGRWAAG
ncbi:MAG TPA: HIT family protein [Thermohalobaculum sp.]|nr:HIT family protein [Thermohalobaculum sp.]